MHILLTLALILLALLPGCATSVPMEDEEAPLAAADAPARSAAPAAAGMYTNPVWPRNFPDPFILQHDGRFYAYATQGRRPGFQALESADLVHWTHRGVVFTTGWASGDYWAPEVVERGGVFYLFYSARDRESGWHNIAVATSSRPLGPFQDRAVLARAQPGERSIIDPHVFTDADGASYLLYSREAPRAILAQRLGPDWLTVTSQPVELITNDQPWEAGVVEAPTLLRRGGVYHLFYSGGAFEGRPDDPMYAVGCASSSAVLGPYSKSNVPILRSVPRAVYGPGHQCVVTLAVPGSAGQDWMLYHAWDATGLPRYGGNRLGRTLRLDPITWENGRPVINGPSIDARPAPLGPVLSSP